MGTRGPTGEFGLESLSKLLRCVLTQVPSPHPDSLCCAHWALCLTSEAKLWDYQLPQEMVLFSLFFSVYPQPPHGIRVIVLSKGGAMPGELHWALRPMIRSEPSWPRAKLEGRSKCLPSTHRIGKLGLRGPWAKQHQSDTGALLMQTHTHSDGRPLHSWLKRLAHLSQNSPRFQFQYWEDKKRKFRILISVVK